MLQFKKRLLSEEKYEACAVFDVNGDGVPDIVSGAYWYEGPDYAKKHYISDVLAISEYHDDFSDYPMDVDGDGRPDIVTGAWWGETLRWRRNPGDIGRRMGDVRHRPLRQHRDDPVSAISTAAACRRYSRTRRESRRRSISSYRDAEGRGTGEFRKCVIGEGASGHGMGFVDVNGDGRMDVDSPGRLAGTAGGSLCRTMDVPSRSSRSAAPACRSWGMT